MLPTFAPSSFSNRPALRVALRFENYRGGSFLTVDAMALDEYEEGGVRSVLSKSSHVYPGETFAQLAGRVRASAAIFGWTLDESRNDHVNGAGR